jgi:hypothetical protein
MVWLIRADQGIVLCDTADLEMPIEELVALQRLITGGATRRFILLSRGARAESAAGLPELVVPFDGAQLASVIADDERGDTRAHAR